MTSLATSLPPLPDPLSEPWFYRGVPARRAFAWLVDSVLIVLLALLAVPATAFIGAFFFPLLLLAVNVFYRCASVARWSATPGMMLAHVELRGPHGGRLGAGEAVVHGIAFTLIAASVLGQIASIVLILASPRGQGLHDLLVGSVALNRPDRA